MKPKKLMTHFTCNKRLLRSSGADPSLLMEGQVIKRKPRIKILGVILDQGLEYREHASGARDKRIKTILALKQLKNSRLEVAMKLSYSKVISITDHVSPIWGPVATQFTIDWLDQV